MLSITAIMLGATLGTTTPGGWSFGLHAGPFDPSISNDGAIRDYYDLLFTSAENDYIYENRPMLVELEEQSLWDVGFGQAGLLYDQGTWSARGKGRICNDADENITPAPQRLSAAQVPATPIFDSQHIQSCSRGLSFRPS